MKVAGKKAEARKKSFYTSLEKMCDAVGVEYKNPHAFRHGIAHYALSKANTPEEIKAISLNLMHESTDITDRIYLQLDTDVIRRVLTNIDDRKKYTNTGVQGISDEALLASLPLEIRVQLAREKLGLA